MKASVVLKRKIKTETFKNYGLVGLGSLVLALGYTLFIVPHNIVPGGVFGISIVINQLTGLSIGLVALSINIPLLVWGAKVLGRQTGIKTALSMVLVSVFIDLIGQMTNHQVIVKDILVSGVFGGILIAVAIAIVMRGGATTGGNDIFVRIIAKRVKLPFSQLILFVDGVIVLIGVLVFGDFTLAAYCIIAIVSISKTLEYLMKKAGQNKTLLVFSEHNIAIEDKILSDKKLTDKVVQLVYKDAGQKMILVTKNTRKLDRIEELIYNIDADAKIISLASSNGLM